jgi:aspartate carbamoyltransferase catalytic subunit
VNQFPHHLLSIDDLGPDGIGEVLRVADSFVEVGHRANPKVPALRGRTVATLCFGCSPNGGVVSLCPASANTRPGSG